MGQHTKEVRAAVRRALILAGAADLVFSWSGTSHQRFDFMVGSRKGRFVFSATPKSNRAVTNAEAMARRRVREYLEDRCGPKNSKAGAQAAQAVGLRGLPSQVQRRAGQ